MYGLRFEAMYDKHCISVKNGLLKLRKTLGTYKNFSKLFYEVWADAFHNYTTILVSFFGREVSDLYLLLAGFYTQIYKFFTVYEW